MHLPQASSPMRQLSGFRFLAALLAVAACGESRDGEQVSGAGSATVSDSAGVTVITNAGEGSLGTLRLREDLRLGVLEGDGPEQFSEVYAVGVMRDGTIAVGDNASGTVRMFDRDGTFLTSLGGRGEGPGEISMLNDVIIVGDSIGLIDWQRGGKLALFTADGTLVRSVAPLDHEGVDFLPLHRANDGWLVLVTGPIPRIAPGDSMTIVNDVVVTELDTPDLEAPPRFGIPAYTLHGAPEGEGGSDWGLFRPSRAYGFDGEGRLYAPVPFRYQIDVSGPSGVVRSVRRQHEPHPLGPEDVEAYRRMRLSQLDTMTMLHEADRPARRRSALARIDRQAGFPLPDVMDPLTAILVSPDGSFWVRVGEPETLPLREYERSIGFFGGAPSIPSRWDLFDPDGMLLGRVTLPARFRPEAVSGREVVGVWHDEFEVEYVLRYVAEPGA